MKSSNIIARDIPDAWFQVLQEIQLEGRDFTVNRGSYVGQKRRQLDDLNLLITHPFTNPLLPELPVHMKDVPPPADLEYLDEYISYLMTGDIKEGETYTYGNRLFGMSAGRYTPVDYLIEFLRDNPYTNQSTLSIAEPNDILCSDPPCLRTISFRSQCIDNKNLYLNMFVHFRSWETWGGLPVNLAGLVNLFQYVIDECNDSVEYTFKRGQIKAFSEGCHIYDHMFDIVDRLIGLDKNDR